MPPCPRPRLLASVEDSQLNPAMNGPDFICIGMAKAGTAWLYDQTRYHPDFWMPPLKEIAYLQRPFNFVRRARTMLSRAERSGEKKAGTRTHQVACDDRSLNFVREAAGIVRAPKDLSAYAALFRHKGGLLSGDITPGYSGIPEDVIAGFAMHCPDTRVLLLVRDPVARVWSHANMLVRAEKISAPALIRRRPFRKLLHSHPIAGFASFPTRIVSRWRETAPQLAFKMVLFDDLVSRPEQTRSEVLEYLGAEPHKQSGELPANYNRKSAEAKLDMPDKIRSLLLDRYTEEIFACAETFGGAAREWPKRYGL